MNKKEIEDRLKEHWIALERLGYNSNNIVGIFLYGSQNYGTDIATSDVDTKCLVVPTFEDIISNEVKSNKTIDFGKSGICTVIDIREYIKEVKKQNINFLEIMFTDYYILNTRYRKFWNQLLSEREKLVKYDTFRHFISVANQAKHTLKQISNVTTMPDKNKKVYNAYRLSLFLEAYRDYLFDSWNSETKVEYKKCLYLSEDTRETLKKIRRGEAPYPLKEIEEILNEEEEKKDFYTKFSYGNTAYLDAVLESFVKDCLKINFDIYKNL